MRLTDIDIKRYSVGDDIVFIITGGQEHIGGISTSYWNDNKICINTNELPHHKEGNLSAEIAKLVTRRTGNTCTVIMGIHIDNATKEEIDYIINKVKIKMELLLKNGATL